MTDRANNAPIGALLDGKFKVLQEIGRGGMAVVYSAENVDIGKRVAVKVLAAELATSRTVTERFMREARAAASLNSPHICEVYDVGTFQDRPFIVMELLKGESLYDKLARERLLSVAETLTITSQAARGLKRAHEHRIVHRDLKPENVFLSVNDEGGLQIKLVDFGLAKFYEPHHDSSNARLTKEGALFGTPAYMSPEQARGKGSVDHRSDLWALACIVYEMLTGRTVWDIDQGVAMILAQVASNPPPQARRFRPDLPEAFDVWLEKALARNVEQRFQTTDEFLSALEQALAAPVTAGHRAQETPVTPGSNPSLASGRPERMGLPPISRELRFAGEAALPPVPPVTSLPRPASYADEPLAAPPGTRKRLHWSAWVGILLAGIAAIGLTITRSDMGRKLVGTLLPGLTEGPPVEPAAWAKDIARAQSLLGDQQTEAALAAFQAAFDAGQSKAARSFLTHASVAVESPSGTCKFLGIGHPRPFDASGDSSKPTAILTPSGLMMAWTDHKEDEEAVRTRLTFLDEPLRRVQAVLEVTPETHAAREPELFKTSTGFGILYWDFGGERPGVYVRQLDEFGHIQGAATLLSTQEASHPYYPAIAPDPQGGFWVAWVEPTSARVFDLVVRKLNDRLKPVSEPVALTGYASSKAGKTQVNRPTLAVRDNVLHIAYSLRRASTQQLLLLRVGADAAARGPSVVAAANETSANDEEGDRFLGTVLTLNATGNNDYPTVRCNKEACYVTWDEAKASAHIAQVGPDGSVVWHRRLPGDTSRPSVVTEANRNDVLVGWYENQRVLVAPLGPSGPASPTVVGRVSAALQQPPPGLVAGARPGDWLVTWRGYEAAAQEPFVARINCR